jgi:hypothetical protein
MASAVNFLNPNHALWVELRNNYIDANARIQTNGLVWKTSAYNNGSTTPSQDAYRGKGCCNLVGSVWTRTPDSGILAPQ